MKESIIIIILLFITACSGRDVIKYHENQGGDEIKSQNYTAKHPENLNGIEDNVISSKITEEALIDEAGRRSESEISRTIQAEYHTIFSTYQRALRKNPSLVGKVLFKITIEPSGLVSKCVVDSSELGDKKLENKLALRIKRINFGAKNVVQTVIDFPISFLSTM